jgi:formiminotetrahydrofolate cyclodeaminase
MSILNRSIIKKIKLTEEKSDYSYWANQSVDARFDALESIREEFNNWKFHDQQGFQRVYRVIKQKPR